MNEPTIAPDLAPPDVLLTESQAAAILNVAPATLTAWRTTKRAAQPPYCRIGAAVRYRRSDIDAFVQASVQRAGA
jgi:predicted DNA-binding transcriptional regulator AlpA